jgi:hypothetical protein
VSARQVSAAWSPRLIYDKLVPYGHLFAFHAGGAIPDGPVVYRLGMLATADGRPQRVRISFPSELEASERQWLVWRAGGPTATRPPKLGQRSTLAALPFQRALGM